jgi:DNA primase
MAKRIPTHKVEEIYSTADILDVVGEFVQLKKRGSNWFGLSPWTNEKTPSFAVSPSKNIFKDFSTGKGGNAVTFLMEAESMSYVEALKWLAARYNIELELEETPEELVSADKRESLLVITEYAAKWFHRQLLDTEEGKRVGLSYFKERGILQSTIEKFQLGYSPDTWDAFAKHAKQAQFNEELLVEAGLCSVSERDGRLIDRFHSRVIFPIHDHMGKVIAYGGRILTSEKKVAKYVNSPETELYHKSKVLYGLAFAKNTIRDRDQCILVEGYMDCVMLAQAGITNVVASSGTALTEEQIRLIKRFTANVLLIYDADNAGINAALRGADLMIEAGLNVRVLLLPAGHDPDSFVKEVGKSGFEQYSVEKAADFLDFKIDQLTGKKRLSDPQEKTQIIHETAGTLARVPDQVQQAVYLDRAAERIGISREIMDRALRQAIQERIKQEKRGKRRGEAGGPPPPTSYDGPPPPDDYGFIPPPLEEEGAPMPEQRQLVPEATSSQEVEIVRLMMNYAEREIRPAGQEEPIALGDFVVNEIGHLAFSSPMMEKMREELYLTWQEERKVNLDKLLQLESKMISELTSKLITIPYEVSPNWEKHSIKAPKQDEDLDQVISSAVLHFQLRQLKQLIQQNHEALRNTTDPEKVDELLRVSIELNNMRKQLTALLGIVVHE